MRRWFPLLLPALLAASAAHGQGFDGAGLDGRGREAAPRVDAPGGCPSGWIARSATSGPGVCVYRRQATCPAPFQLARGTDGFVCRSDGRVHVAPTCRPGDRPGESGRTCLSAAGRYPAACPPGFDLTETSRTPECQAPRETTPACPQDTAFVPDVGECRGVLPLP